MGASDYKVTNDGTVHAFDLFIAGLSLGVESYGAKGDGVTDDTVSIQAAIDAEDGPVVFKQRTYCFTSLTLRANTKFFGAGWASPVTEVFGHGDWLTMSNHDGTILKCTSTSGDAIKFITTQTVYGIEIRNLMLLGPGSGTGSGINTIIGDGSTYGLSRSYGFLNNVLIANFYCGVKFEYFISNSIQDLSVRGCTTGADWGSVTICTETKLYNFSVEKCATGIKYERVDNIAIFGGLVQSNTIGINFAPAQAGYLRIIIINDVWFENNTTPWTITNGSYVINGVSFENCISYETWTWTIGVSDTIYFFKFDNCNMLVTIDFSQGGGIGFSFRNTSIANLTGLSATAFINFSGQNLILSSLGLVCDLIGNGKRITWGTSYPTTGDWIVGDIRWQNIPQSNQPPGWVCTTAGTPGTWKAMAKLD